GDRATQPPVVERRIAGEAMTLHVVHVAVRERGVGRQAIREALLQLRGDTVRIVLRLVHELDDVRSERRLRECGSSPPGRVERSVHDATVRVARGWLGQIAIDEEQLVQRAGVLAFDTSGDARRQTTLDGQRYAKV